MRIAVTRRDLRLGASFTAFTGALALLVADSPAPTCARYEGIDQVYLFENTCTPETTSGEVHFVVPGGPDPELEQQALLIDQAAVGGLYLQSVSVLYDTGECDADEAKGTGRARGLHFVVLAGPPPVEDGESAPGAFSCYLDGDYAADAVQTYSCNNHDGLAEPQSCTLTLTPKT